MSEQTEAVDGAALLPDVAAVNTAKLAGFDEIAAILEIDADPAVVTERVRELVETAAALAEQLNGCSAALDLARQTRKTLFGLSTQLMAQLSWCVGYLAGDDQQLPPEIKATIDDAIATLPTIGETPL